MHRISWTRETQGRGSKTFISVIQIMKLSKCCSAKMQKKDFAVGGGIIYVLSADMPVHGKKYHPSS
jgi:hypothetical protein